MKYCKRLGIFSFILLQAVTAQAPHTSTRTVTVSDAIETPLPLSALASIIFKDELKEGDVIQVEKKQVNIQAIPNRVEDMEEDMPLSPPPPQQEEEEEPPQEEEQEEADTAEQGLEEQEEIEQRPDRNTEFPINHGPPTDMNANNAIEAQNATLTAASHEENSSAQSQITGCKTQGQIALTYSEGPSDVSAKIARQLNKADARANFFVNATWLYTQQYAMVLQNIYNAGHFIGMTYRVPGDNPSALSDEELRNDILNNAHTVESVIQVAPKYVRLHYTEEKDVRTENMLRELGFVIVNYNLDSLDYLKKDATGPNSIQQVYSDTFKKYKDTYDAKGSFISIQYDLPFTGSLDAVPHIINTIAEEGYSMVRMDGCLNDPTPYKKSASSTEYVHDKFSLNQAGYRQGQKAVIIDSSPKPKDEQENADGELVDMLKKQGLESSAHSQYTASFLFVAVTVSIIFNL